VVSKRKFLSVLILGIPGESVRFVRKGSGAPRQILECFREGRAVIMVADHYISSEALEKVPGTLLRYCSPFSRHRPHFTAETTTGSPTLETYLLALSVPGFRKLGSWIGESLLL
jgi:hypothetical protein